MGQLLMYILRLTHALQQLQYQRCGCLFQWHEDVYAVKV